MILEKNITIIKLQIADRNYRWPVTFSRRYYAMINEFGPNGKITPAHARR